MRSLKALGASIVAIALVAIPTVLTIEAPDVSSGPDPGEAITVVDLSERPAADVPNLDTDTEIALDTYSNTLTSTYEAGSPGGAAGAAYERSSERYRAHMASNLTRDLTKRYRWSPLRS